MFKQAKEKVLLCFEPRDCSIPITELFKPKRKGKKMLPLELKTQMSKGNIQNAILVIHIGKA